MEVFSIVDINKNKLDGKIEKFVQEKDHEPYIFANKETLDALKRQTEQVLTFVYPTGCTDTRKYPICKYRGYKIFRDDSLGYGEIELR